MDVTKVAAIAKFFNDLADWLDENVEHEINDEFDYKLSDIRHNAQALFDEIDRQDEQFTYIWNCTFLRIFCFRNSFNYN